MEKRNSLFFLLLNILDNNRPSVKLRSFSFLSRPFQTVSDIETTGV